MALDAQAFVPVFRPAILVDPVSGRDLKRRVLQGVRTRIRHGSTLGPSPLMQLWQRITRCYGNRAVSGTGGGSQVSAQGVRRVGQILDQVVRILDPHAQPYQSVVDPDAPPHLGRHRGVGHHRRVVDQ